MHRFEYLIYSSIFAVIFGLVLLARKDLRNVVLVPCAVGAIGGPLSELAYYHDYWRPETLFGVGRPGLEDILFGISAVGLAVCIYPLLAHKQVHGHDRDVCAAFVYLLIAVVGLIVLNKVVGVNSVIATAIIFIVLTVSIYPQRRDLIAPSLLTGISMTVLAGGVYGIGLHFWFKDTLEHIWLLDHSHLGWVWFGTVPVTELLFFFTAGCFFEAFGMYVRRARYRSLPLHKQLSN
jgi:hypothetical protein